jgi:hypothetical protein
VKVAKQSKAEADGKTRVGDMNPGDVFYDPEWEGYEIVTNKVEDDCGETVVRCVGLDDGWLYYEDTDARYLVVDATLHVKDHNTE